MSQEDAVDLESSSLVIKLGDTPRKAMKSPLRRKRCTQFSPVLGKNAKQRRICSQKSYRSPLIHLGKTLENTCSTSLDDSIIVLDEIKISPGSDDSRLRSGRNKRSVSPDDSVIILSDNEAESRTETNVGAKATPTRVLLKIPRVSTSKLCSKINTINIESISSDSEDEKIVRNDSGDGDGDGDDDPSMSNPYAETIVVDNSPGIETDRDMSSSAIFEPGIGESAKNVKDSAIQPITVGPKFSPKGIQAAAEQLMSIRSIKEVSKRYEPPFLIDTKGEPLRGVSNSKRKKMLYGKEEQANFLQNPNWHNFLKRWYAETLFETEPTAGKNQPKVDRIASNCNKVKGVSSASLPAPRKSASINQHKVNGIRRNGSKEQPLDLSPVPAPKSSAPTNQPAINKIGRYYTTGAVNKEPGSLREIVIDGCNIAMAYTNERYFSEDGIKLVIDYFRLRGHTVKVFVPQHQRSGGRPLLETLYTKGIAVFTPSRSVGGRKIVSYDDRFILDYAMVCDGIVVSRDQYRDLYREKEQWKNIIENRLLVPTFVGNCVMFPEDPLGKSGPTLEQFLRH